MYYIGIDLGGTGIKAGVVNEEGKIVTNGGRVLCATALGNDIKQARDNAYALINSVSWKGMFYRNDIAYRAIDRLK